MVKKGYWIISLEGESHKWDNDLHDDFLQFLPEYFTKILGKKITHKDLTVEWVPRMHQHEAEKYFGTKGVQLRAQRNKPGTLELQSLHPVVREAGPRKVLEDGTRVQRKIITPKGYYVDKEITLSKLKTWPYKLNSKGQMIQAKDKKGKLLFTKSKKPIYQYLSVELIGEE